MIRGALILAAGYVVGYLHAASQTDEIQQVVNNFKQSIAEVDTPEPEQETTP